MKRFFGFFAIVMFLGIPFAAHADSGIETDTSDPLLMLRDDAILSTTDISYGHDILRMGQ